MHPWSDLTWWNCGERQVVEEKLHDFERSGIVCNPKQGALYRALSLAPLRETRVAIIGQDPYPSHEMATGVAFSIPKDVEPSRYPQTLRIILNEYHSDLHHEFPRHGDLTRWAKQGVLLWNAIPSCSAGHSLSHDWDEWSYLTREIIERLSEKGIVFAFLGTVAGRFNHGIDPEKNRVITCSHPSPRGNKFGKIPFTGSRLFSTINAKLVEIQQEPINWELTDEPPRKGNIQTPELGGVRVLPNITGVSLGGLKRPGTSPNIYTSLAF
jgi:uracil-DNA glycosylase